MNGFVDRFEEIGDSFGWCGRRRARRKHFTAAGKDADDEQVGKSSPENEKEKRRKRSLFCFALFISLSLSLSLFLSKGDTKRPLTNQ